MKGRIRIEQAVFAIVAGALLSGLPAWADKDPLSEFSRACRDVSKAVSENHSNPFKSQAEFERALENVRVTLDQLRELEKSDTAKLSSQDRTTLQEYIRQCSGALKSAK